MNSFRTDEAPKDGTEIVAIGRVISTDEFSTLSDPFTAGIFWLNHESGFEGWHFISDRMSVARTPDDKVMIDWWLPFPKAEPHETHEGECPKSYGSHPCTCEKETV